MFTITINSMSELKDRNPEEIYFVENNINNYILKIKFVNNRNEYNLIYNNYQYTIIELNEDIIYNLFKFKYLRKLTYISDNSDKLKGFLPENLDYLYIKHSNLDLLTYAILKDIYESMQYVNIYVSTCDHKIDLYTLFQEYKHWDQPGNLNPTECDICASMNLCVEYRRIMGHQA